MEEIYEKPQEFFRVKPNLEDYEAKYKSFNWQNAWKEVDWAGENFNAASIAVDRHANSQRKDKVALYWRGEEKKEEYTFKDISNLSNKFANVLKNLGAEKGDRAFIFLPRIPPLYISFLGIMKTGAIAGTMFSAFGPSGILDRLKDSGAKFLITDSELKKRVSEIRKDLPDLKNIIVVGGAEGDEISYEDEMKKASKDFEVEKTNPEDKAFMLYTSGTTGKPKGVCHAHSALLQQHITANWVLDLKDDDIYWCTADPGWVTGVAYGILGSWSNAATSVAFEGRFDPDSWYSVIQNYKVSVWYTAPTAIRMLMAAGEDVPKKYDLSSLRHICSVGEPLNPEAIRWGLQTLSIPIHDSWWQTESGGIMISNYPCMKIKLGSMGKPLPGIIASIVDDNAKELPLNQPGNLAIKPPWPAMMREIWKNQEKYDSYFKNGWYITGDVAFKDSDGYFWFVSRADDVIKTSGERVGPFEVESALIEHPSVIEAGVIGKPDPMRGEIIKAFVILKKEVEPSDQLKEELKNFVKTRLAGHAYPREIDFVQTLPKTRSGKIMRRILKAKELGLPIGDTSSLEEY